MLWFITEVGLRVGWIVIYYSSTAALWSLSLLRESEIDKKCRLQEERLSILEMDMITIQTNTDMFWEEIEDCDEFG